MIIFVRCTDLKLEGCESGRDRRIKMCIHQSSHTDVSLLNICLSFIT